MTVMLIQEIVILF